MSPFSKIVLIALTALSGAAASAHEGTSGAPGFKAKSVIASHEAAPGLSTVAQHVRHRHHHRKHRGHPVRHGR